MNQRQPSLEGGEKQPLAGKSIMSGSRSKAKKSLTDVKAKLAPQQKTRKRAGSQIPATPAPNWIQNKSTGKRCAGGANDVKE